RALPPTSPFFPYTTLFRSERGFGEVEGSRPGFLGQLLQPNRALGFRAGGQIDLTPEQRHVPYDDLNGLVRPVLPETGPHALVPRSEEHTSELQSLTNTVCR